MIYTSDSQMLTLVDTNILVYAFDPSQGQRHLHARDVCNALLAQDRFCLSTQVLQELYVTLTRQAGIAIDTVLSVTDDLAQWPVFTVDYRAIRHAVQISRDHQVSFWDALLLSAANRMGAAVLLTEDLNHGQTIAGVRIHNPFVDLSLTA